MNNFEYTLHVNSVKMFDRDSFENRGSRNMEYCLHNLFTSTSDPTIVKIKTEDACVQSDQDFVPPDKNCVDVILI